MRDTDFMVVEGKQQFQHMKREHLRPWEVREKERHDLLPLRTTPGDFLEIKKTHPSAALQKPFKHP